MAETILDVQSVTKRFGGFQALSRVSIQVKAGERFGLIGPNGSGKTTLINCISGTLRNDEGRILFRGADVFRLAHDLPQFCDELRGQPRDLLGHIRLVSDIHRGLALRHAHARGRPALDVMIVAHGTRHEPRALLLLERVARCEPALEHVAVGADEIENNHYAVFSKRQTW